MGTLKNLIFGSPEQRKRDRELKQKEKQAYRVAYERAKLRQAQLQGSRAGKLSARPWSAKISDLGSRLSAGMEGGERWLGGVGLGGPDLFGLEKPSRRKTKSKAKKRKTTTITVNGTTITIGRKRSKKRKKRG